MRRSTAPAVLAVTGTLLATGVAAPAAAQHSPEPPEPATLAEGLTTPLSLAVARDGTVYVTQDFAGVLTRVAPDGSRTDLVTAEGAGVGAVSARRGLLTYAETRIPGPENPAPDAPPPTALLRQRDPAGETRTLADLWAFEAAHNPDADVTYGLTELSDACAAQLPAEIGPPTNEGVVESNPYATVTLPGGDVVVADAGANTLVHVSANGEDPRTIALLPPTEILLTEEVVAAAEAALLPEGVGLPDCVVGQTFLAEPVPTDVELGRDGDLYVTTLPGGPGELGAFGSVYRVNPRSGHADLVATGIRGATGLALGPRGDIYVTEFFGDRLSVIPRGSDTPEPYLDATQPSAVEWRGGSLYFTAGGVGDLTGPPPADGRIFRVDDVEPAHR